MRILACDAISVPCRTSISNDAFTGDRLRFVPSELTAWRTFSRFRRSTAIHTYSRIQYRRAIGCRACSPGRTMRGFEEIINDRCCKSSLSSRRLYEMRISSSPMSSFSSAYPKNNSRSLFQKSGLFVRQHASRRNLRKHRRIHDSRLNRAATLERAGDEV